MPELSQIVDLDRYPLHEPESAAYVAAVDAAREGLRSVGCAVVKDLVRPDAVALLNALFQVVAPPEAPYPGCGTDPMPDALDCISYPGC